VKSLSSCRNTLEKADRNLNRNTATQNFVTEEDFNGQRYHIVSEAVLQGDVELDVSRVVPQADATLRGQALGNRDDGII
jgi:hypothetical protein